MNNNGRKLPRPHQGSIRKGWGQITKADKAQTFIGRLFVDRHWSHAMYLLSFPYMSPEGWVLNFVHKAVFFLSFFSVLTSFHLFIVSLILHVHFMVFFPKALECLDNSTLNFTQC
jgi:hypothetical protein